MNKRQRLVQEQFLNNEEAVIKRLKQVYGQSLKDITSKAQELQNQITGLQAVLDMVEDAAEKDRLKSMIQSKVYQKQYQDALKKQINSILDNMQVEEFKTVSAYLQKCYEDGFIGTMFDLQGQGIPLCFPLDQEAMVRAVQLDSKISNGLYSRLGEDVTLLKKKITAQVSRGISTGMSFQQVAQQLAGYTNIGYNNAIRIARTEGHRIQVQSAMDACYKAKEKGADVVKQWDSTLDDSTRESHVAVDGEIRELDKPFSNGLMFPGDPSGGAAEVVNCRCALLQRAKWALDEDELKVLQDRASFYGLDKSETFEDYKKNYLKAAEEIKTQESRPKFTPAKTLEEAEEYGRQFVVKKTWSGDGNISYKGLSVDSANKLNETLADLYSRGEIPKLRNIQPMNFREKLWRGSETTPMAYRGAQNGDLFFNPKIIKDKKAISKYFAEGEKAFKICSENLDKFTGKKKELVATYIKAGRQLVADNVEDRLKAMIQHEMGHHVQYQFVVRDETGRQIVADGFEKYAVGISGYATHSAGEYIAESFCAFLNGEADRIDPALKKYFEGLVR